MYKFQQLTQNVCTRRLSCTSRTITRHSHATFEFIQFHSSDVILSTMASQNGSLTIVYSIVYSCADQRKHQSSASLAFVRLIRRWPVNSPQKGPATRKKVFIWWRHHVLSKIPLFWKNQPQYRCLERIRYSKEVLNQNSLKKVVFDATVKLISSWQLRSDRLSR